MKEVIQAPSTQAILNRPKDQDAKWLLRPLPTYETQPEKIRDAYIAGSTDQLVSKRQVSHEEAFIEYQRKRHMPNNGGSTADGASQERKEHAAQCFIFSPPAELTEEEKARVIKAKHLEAVIASELSLAKKPKPLEKLNMFERFKLVLGITRGTDDLFSWRDKK